MQTFDFVIGADLLYRRSYARKVAAVVRTKRHVSAVVFSRTHASLDHCCCACLRPLRRTYRSASVRGWEPSALHPLQVGRLLRPGGTFLCCTPLHREGLPLMRRLLDAGGFSCEEAMAPSEWRCVNTRSNPPRRGAAACD